MEIHISHYNSNSTLSNQYTSLKIQAMLLIYYDLSLILLNFVIFLLIDLHQLFDCFGVVILLML